MTWPASSLPWPTMFIPRARYQIPWSDNVLILAPGEIPTVDFYLSTRLTTTTEKLLFRRDSRTTVEGMEDLPHGTFVIIVRHASRAWLRALERLKNRWSGVAYLMDDDIPGAWRCHDVPLDYGLWTTGRYLLAKNGLASICDRVWLSTVALGHRFSLLTSTLVEPLAFSPRRSGAASFGCRRWGYHGTRIHLRELRWLLPVVETVQRSVPGAVFEVFGNHRVEEMFSHLTDITVIRPRPWPEYVRHCHNGDLAVGLAPLLSGPFNAVRSHTKVFDINRCGAVGLYSNRQPYADALAGSGAVLLPDDHQAWAAETIRLLLDDERRLTKYQQMSVWLASRPTNGKLENLIAESNPS